MGKEKRREKEIFGMGLTDSRPQDVSLGNFVPNLRWGADGKNWQGIKEKRGETMVSPLFS
jgi:hypothetical protein